MADKLSFYVPLCHPEIRSNSFSMSLSPFIHKSSLLHHVDPKVCFVQRQRYNLSMKMDFDLYSVVSLAYRQGWAAYRLH